MTNPVPAVAPVKSHKFTVTIDNGSLSRSFSFLEVTNLFSDGNSAQHSEFTRGVIPNDNGLYQIYLGGSACAVEVNIAGVLIASAVQANVVNYSLSDLNSGSNRLLTETLCLSAVWKLKWK